MANSKKKTITPVIATKAKIRKNTEISIQFLTAEEAEMLNTVLGQKSHKNKLFTFIKTLINY